MADQINGILAAGRADLCALGRPFLGNPAWLQMELARLGHDVTLADLPQPQLPEGASA